MKSPKAKLRYPLVLVRWVDAAHFQGWDSEEGMAEVVPSECVSVGFQIRGDKAFIRLAQSYSHGGPKDVGDVIAIPRPWVKTVVKVSE